MEFGSTWMEYLNISTPILWVTILENGRILKSLKIESIWDKYGEKVITCTIFFCTLIRGSKYFSDVLPHTSTQYVECGKTKNYIILVMILFFSSFNYNT